MELTEAISLVFRLSQIDRQYAPAHIYVLGTGTYIVLVRMWGETVAIASADMLPIVEELLSRKKRIDEEHAPDTGHD